MTKTKRRSKQQRLRKRANYRSRYWFDKGWKPSDIVAPLTRKQFHDLIIASRRPGRIVVFDDFVDIPSPERWEKVKAILQRIADGTCKELRQ